MLPAFPGRAASCLLLALAALSGPLALMPVARAQPPPGVRFAVPPPGTLSQSRNVVYGIDQDAEGYLWVASELGLHRYDGVEFVGFRADPEDPGAMPGNRVTGVSVAPSGDVWAAVDRFGLVRIREGQLDRFPLPDTLALDPTVAVDARGAIWVTSGGWEVRASGSALARPSAYRFDPERRRLRRVNGVALDVWGLHLDGDRGLWLVTPEGVIQRTARGWRRFAIPNAAPVLGSPMRVWDGERLLAFDGERFRRVPLPESVDFADANGAMLMDRGGRLWARTGGEALSATDLATGRLVEYAPDPSRMGALPDVGITRMFEDRDGVLWIGTGQGLRTLLPGWDVFAATPLGAAPYATVLNRGASGRVWAGAACEPLAEFLPDGTTRPLAETEPRVAAVLEREAFCALNVLEARDGTFWFAGWPFRNQQEGGGLLRVAPDGHATRYLPRAGDPGAIRHTASRHVFEDARGRIWAATEGGLSRYRPATDDFQTFAHDPADSTSLPATVIWSLADAPNDKLWVGTYGGGLALFDPATGRARSWQHDPADPASIPSNSVTVIHASGADPAVLWVGTYEGGLARFDLRTGRFARVGRAEGLPDLTIASLLETARGALWLGTASGLVRYDPASGAVRVFTEAEGLPSASFGLYDAATLPDGRLAFIAGTDVVAFDPAATRPARTDAPVVLRSLRVGGQRRSLPFGGVPIRLGPGDRALAVEVAALSFRAPQRLRYAVRLEGADDAWLPLGADRSAAWAGLAPGRYTLRARAGLSSGTWSPNELAIPVLVAPAWWQTWVFRLIAGLSMLAAIVWGVREFSQRRLRAEVQRLETEQRIRAERERISRDLHDHVGGQLSGLIASAELARLQRRRASGGAINTTTASGAEPDPIAPEADVLARIEEDARETMRQLRETVWALHHEAITLGGFRDRLRTDIEARLRGQTAPEATVVLDGDAAHVLSPLQALHLYRIAREAVTNSLKHAEASHLTITIRQRPGSVTVEVHDDGAFREASGDGAPGDVSGFGMGSMQARADALGGRFELDTAEGTTVRVTVPTDPDAGGERA